MQNKLIFIYNANSGKINSMLDFAHKTISPSTYNCNLCKITYGALEMKHEWRDYVASLPYPVQFLHKDELAAQYPQQVNINLPAVLLDNNGAQQILVDTAALNKAKSISDIIGLIEAKTQNLDIGN